MVLIKGKVKIRRRTIKEIITDFREQCTFHGISHAEIAWGRWWKTFWLTIFIFFLIFLIMHCTSLVLKYFAYRKTVAVELQYAMIPFPAVTFCSLNPYKLSQVLSIPNARKAFDDMYDALGQPNPFTQPEFKRIKRNIENSTEESRSRRHRLLKSRCLCEVNLRTGEREPGSCLAENPIGHNSKCLCDHDNVSDTYWPCFPPREWKNKNCTDCNQLGHCPKRFDKPDKPCICHDEYNFCVQPSEDDESAKVRPKTTTTTTESAPTEPGASTTTTLSPETRKLFSYEEMTDDVAITTKANENLNFALGSLGPEARYELSHDRDDFVQKCSFNGRQCDIENDFTLLSHQTYGNCWTFNGNASAEEKVLKRAGAVFGLRVLLKVDVKEFLPTTQSIGIKLIPHEKTTIPFPDTHGFSAPTGYMSSFAVRMTRFERLPHPYGKCLNESKNPANHTYYPYDYSYETCLRDCRQRAIVDECGCADPRLKIPQGVVTCPPDDFVLRACVERVDSAVSGGTYKYNCSCEIPCNQNDYKVRFSMAEWPSATAAAGDCDQNDRRCRFIYRRNYAMVQVFFEQLNYEILKEKPTYPITKLVCDLGGTLGLWLGISIVSLMEVTIFIYQVVITYLQSRMARPHVALMPLELMELNMDDTINDHDTTIELSVPPTLSICPDEESTSYASDPPSSYDNMSTYYEQFME